MSDLKQLRNRIKTIKSTQKITQAMHVVAAAKLKKVREQAEDTNLYSVTLEKIMNELSKAENIANLTTQEQRFFAKNFNLPYLLIVMTTQRGLCGGFNANIIRRVKTDIEKLKQAGKEVKLLIIGKKGLEALKNDYSDLIIGSYQITQDNAICVTVQVKNKIIALEAAGEIGRCDIYYNQFKNIMTQLLTHKIILPVEVQNIHPETEIEASFSLYEYEGENLVSQVVNLYVTSMISYGLLQNKASEEGARMTAMDNATNNAEDLIDKLTLKLNRSRQATITTELTEIISGAEATR